jgi:histidinol dehydrogenase
MQDEMEKFVLDELGMLEKFKEHRDAFQTKAWQIIDEIFEEAEQAFLNQFIEDPDENPAAFRKVIKFIKVFRAMPESMQDAIDKSVENLEEVEQHQLQVEALAQATAEGVD